LQRSKGTRGENPFAGFTTDELLVRLHAGGRIDFKPTWPQVLQDIMSKCWRAEPADRPQFCDVAAELSFDKNPIIYAALRSTCTNKFAEPNEGCAVYSVPQVNVGAEYNRTPAGALRPLTQENEAGAVYAIPQLNAGPQSNLTLPTPTPAPYLEPSATQPAVYDAQKGPGCSPVARSAEHAEAGSSARDYSTSSPVVGYAPSTTPSERVASEQVSEQASAKATPLSPRVLVLAASRTPLQQQLQSQHPYQAPSTDTSEVHVGDHEIDNGDLYHVIEPDVKAAEPHDYRRSVISTAAAAEDDLHV
jgi:hypothetical protein